VGGRASFACGERRGLGIRNIPLPGCKETRGRCGDRGKGKGQERIEKGKRKRGLYLLEGKKKNILESASWFAKEEDGRYADKKGDFINWGRKRGNPFCLTGEQGMKRVRAPCRKRGRLTREEKKGRKTIWRVCSLSVRACDRKKGRKGSLRKKKGKKKKKKKKKKKVEQKKDTQL